MFLKLESWGVGSLMYIINSDHILNIKQGPLRQNEVTSSFYSQVIIELDGSNGTFFEYLVQKHENARTAEDALEDSAELMEEIWMVLNGVLPDIQSLIFVEEVFKEV